MGSPEMDTPNMKSTPVLGIRHMQTFLIFTGLGIIHFVKVDMSIAIVAMTDPSTENNFDWSLKRQSVILSAFKWGYLVSKIPGGVLAARFGGKIVLISCAISTIIVCFILPTAAHYCGWQAVCVCRIIQGLAQGLLLPAVQTLTGKWIPAEERARLSAIMFSGSLLGCAIEYLMAGLLADRWGWPSIFYFNGIVLAIWTLVYISIGSSSPQECKMIKEDERLYIQKSLGQANLKNRLGTPWKAIFTSVPFIVLMLTHMGYGWGYWFILTEMPTYISKVLNVKIKQNGFLSALPYLVGTATCYVFGFLSDFALKKNLFSVTNCRKTNNTIATYLPAIFLIVCSYMNTNVTAAIAMLSTSMGLMSAGYCGYNIVHLDLSPNHAGQLHGITGFASNVFSTFAPLSVGFLVLDETLPSEWQKVFFLSAVIFVASNTLFLCFGTCEKQKWNDEIVIEDTTEKQPTSTGAAELYITNYTSIQQV